MEKIFCMNCGIKLPVTFLKGIEGMEFQDGMYCKLCGKVKKEKIQKAAMEQK